MTFTILLALAALAISGVSAYFSIVGLAAIFAASVVPIIIMGAVVEYGKVISVAWVHWHWAEASKRIRAGMCLAIGVAMILTSVGVFGFLSKAHVEQTAQSTESVAQVERIDTEVLRQKSIIERGENKIIALESTGSRTDDTIQIQIDGEQTRIDAAAARIQPAIDEQNTIIAGQSVLYKQQLDEIDEELNRLQAYIDAGEIKKAQQLIGEKSKGGWGPKTSETARLWRLERTNKKAELYTKIEDSSQNNLAIIAARKEISRIRQAYEAQLAESNKLMNRLRAKLGNAEVTNVDEQLDEQYERISNANKQIETLTNEKYEIEAEYRQLEAEVGPIKYIAEFIYQEDATADLLERAVKVVIIMLLLVLDPFAVLLVMAATDGWKWHKKGSKLKQLGYESTDNGDAIIQLEETLAEEQARHDGLMKTLAIRNTEMNELRTELKAKQEIQTIASNEDAIAMEDLASQLITAEATRDELQSELEIAAETIDAHVIALAAQKKESANEIKTVITERDRLQLELNQLGENLDIVQQEVKKVPGLESEIRRLEGLGKISSRQDHMINITTPGNEASLRHKVQMLDEKIKSMIKLSKFDLESAQELVEVKQAKLDVEVRLAELQRKYDALTN